MDNEPEYFKYNNSNELFLPDLKIDFSVLSKNLIELEALIDLNNLYNQLISFILIIIS